MSRLPPRDPKEREDHDCHKCGEKSRYIHKHVHWCRTCLDIEQYPQLAHLTQQQREDLRAANAKGSNHTRSIYNLGNVQKKEEGIGFAVSVSS